jgi:predicted tellurium resistance membrane protein TerC
VLFADASTSVDNIIAVAALAKNNPLLLVIGLVLSILLLLIGSVLLSILMRRVFWIILIAAIILTATAAQMIVQDTQPFITPILMATATTIWWNIFIYLIAFGFTGIAAFIWCRNHLWT